jgi:hypothetical protein
MIRGVGVTLPCGRYENEGQCSRCGDSALSWSALSDGVP